MFKKTIIFSLFIALCFIASIANNKCSANNLPYSIGSSLFTAKQMSESQIKKELKELDELYKKGEIDKGSYEEGKQQLNFKLEQQEEVDLDHDKTLVEDEDFQDVDDEAAQDEPVTPEIINELIEETGD